MKEPIKKKMNEKTRIKRYESKKKPFIFEEPVRGLTLALDTKIEEASVVFQRKLLRDMKCYLYHFNNLGITNKDFEREFEGKRILIYRKAIKRISRRSKCQWCYQPVDDFYYHIFNVHNKTEESIALLEFQKNIYRELLRIVRETPHYMSMAFINAGCQMCDNPVMEGRELCCSIPTSFRDRSRSLKIMGFACSNIDDRFFSNNRYGQIILAP